jgi:hypothetical protein
MPHPDQEELEALRQLERDMRTLKAFTEKVYGPTAPKRSALQWSNVDAQGTQLRDVVYERLRHLDVIRRKRSRVN